MRKFLCVFLFSYGASQQRPCVRIGLTLAYLNHVKMTLANAKSVNRQTLENVVRNAASEFTRRTAIAALASLRYCAASWLMQQILSDTYGSWLLFNRRHVNQDTFDSGARDEGNGLSGSHRSTHIGSDLASRELTSQSKSQAFRITRS